jgi:hypothetical protein
MERFGGFWREVSFSAQLWAFRDAQPLNRAGGFSDFLGRFAPDFPRCQESVQRISRAFSPTNTADSVVIIVRRLYQSALLPRAASVHQLSMDHS